jgi:hypothetical protein
MWKRSTKLEEHQKNIAAELKPERKALYQLCCLSGTETLNLFNDPPAEGVLFPYLLNVRANDRATEFRSR